LTDSDNDNDNKPKRVSHNVVDVKTVAVREIKLTLSFMIPMDKYNEKHNKQYIKAINSWIKQWIMVPLNSTYPSSDLDPMLAYVSAEDVTD